MNTDRFKEILRTIPSKAGVYLFIQNNPKKFLYIGKASNLKNRVAQYLKNTDVRLRKMISLAENIKFIETGLDIEALILESQQIKKHKPLFNIMLRDDKQYFYVGFTSEKFPRIFLTHRPRRHESLITNHGDKKIHNSLFIGPFTDGTALKTTLGYLRRIFPYCTCKQLHNNYCLNYHIGKCLGFCCLKQPITDNQKPITYNKNIRAIKDILSGKKNSLIKKLEKEMIKLGNQEKFEEAIELRDKLAKLKRVFENIRVINFPTNIQHYDTPKNHDRNILVQLKDRLGLKNIPQRIEAYDIANIQNQHAVGVMVVFILRQSSGQAEWKPDKKEYRKFKITSLKETSGGDVGMLKQVLERRSRHPEWPAPDLILVDGGKAQLNIAMAIWSELGIMNNELRIIALTKNKKHIGTKIYMSGKKSPIHLSQLSVSTKNLLLNIDSEAHRFAITYYRKQHRKNLLK